MPTSVEQSVRCCSKYAIEYWHSLKPRAFGDIFNSNHCSMVRLKMELGEDKAKAIVAKFIADFVNFFSTSGTMNAKQILDTAELLINSDNAVLKLDDLKFCFNRAKLGEYGQVYRMDGAVILDFVRRYFNERIRESINTTMRGHEQMKEYREQETSYAEIITKR